MPGGDNETAVEPSLGLLGGVERQCGGKASAVGTEVGRFEDVGLVESGRGVQREFIGPQEVLPIAVVLRRIS